jgi:valyl-tRNA synthetase
MGNEMSSVPDLLPKSEAEREELFKRTKHEEEELGAKMSKALILKLKISELKSSKDFLCEKDLAQREIEMNTKSLIVVTSALAESKVRLHECCIKERSAATQMSFYLFREESDEKKILEIKSSGQIISPLKKVLINTQIEKLQKSITKAHCVQKEIWMAENDSGFCSKAEIQILQKKLEEVQKLLRKLQSLQPGKVNLYCITLRQWFSTFFISRHT